MNAPLVSICCLTYNHAPFIRQCLDGFISQKTDFPFELIIHDDASNDGTADIIREYEARYPQIIKPIYQTENQYSQRKDVFLEIMFPHCTGKYIALCEGDDYWTDPNKLQEQADFLESHPDYSMCSGGHLRYKDGEITQICVGQDGTEGFEYTNTLDYWPMQTLTVMTRKDAYAELLKKYKKAGRCIDQVLFYFLLKAGKGWCFSKIYGVYRMHSGGVWAGLSDEGKNYFGYRCYKKIRV